MTALAYRLRCVVLEPDSESDEARHEGDDPWQRFERAKAALARTARSPAEYEAGLKAIADEEGV